MGDIAFIVRTLPATASLKGAFRVHLAPETLQHLRLKVGDLCTIIGEDGTSGAGIAWRAADKMGNAPKIQPAKMSEVLRDAYGFKQGTQVRIEAAATTLRPATRIALTEITPVGYEAGVDDDRWKVRCVAQLAGVEAIAVGTTFDVPAGEGIKKRFFVEHIETEPAQEVPFLSYLTDHTDLQILDAALQSPTTTTSTSNQRPFHIDAAHIAGLSEQLKQLNLRLRLLCTAAENENRPRRLGAKNALVYGYAGTGKTLLLDSLAKVHGIKKVVRLDGDQLLGTASKNESLINSTFQEAIASQPSLVLIDNIDTAAASNDVATRMTAKMLAKAIDKTNSARVLTIATARSVAGVHETLCEPGRLQRTIELPIPDAGGRTQILKLLLSSETCQPVDLPAELGAMTHGYTGRDLTGLVDTASLYAYERMNPESDDWVSIHLQDSIASRPIKSHPADIRNASIASTLVEAAPEPHISMLDFEKALQEIRPSALREIIVEPPKVTFDDIGGSGALRAQFDRLINWPIQHQALAAQFTGLQPKRGILLYGPPGCSKTMTAQAVASTYGWNFLAVKGAELISMYVGESERAIREIFRKARQAAPTIIFFDEIDSIATARTGGTDASKSLNVVTTLLNEMDGFEAAKDVLVLAATNKPESLDSAILRSGRFDDHIYLGPPDSDARREILKICVRGAPGVIDLEPLLAQSEGMSGAEIKNAWRTACELAMERAVLGSQTIANMTTQDMEAGIRMTTRVITTEMLQAYEEFGRRS
ncbi:hypothetical protein AMS68_000801 [Peltaster fructicola]|uniref:AAA+ ATPase domain-containing protein n=1 Tax=Peltaster fructicola TaxID=286661 RepID=A0A6H0XKM6_9PEZI|nr:hypothetical protein AMS68_000801 [Peltaster fructicola]